MSDPNPYYNPAWRTLRDQHEQAAKRAESEMDRLAAGGLATYDAYKVAAAEFKRHHQAGIATYKMQHTTVQDYAAWVFGSFNVSMNDHGAGIPVPQVDFETLRTIDAVWSRIHGAITDAANDKRNSLPVGQPEGLVAFSDGSSPGLTRAWRQFLPDELYPGGYAGGLGVRTLMSIDEQEGSWNVCFMHHWGAPGVSVTNAIAQLATAVYREACAIAEQQAPKAKGARAWVARLAGRKHAAILDPDRFHFYEHTPPQSLNWREDFARVVLRFEDGKYREPQWIRYSVIPRIIQSARFDCALDATQVVGNDRALITEDQHVRSA